MTADSIEICIPRRDALCPPKIPLIGRIVAASTRHPLIVLLAAVVLTAAALVYLGGHFNMTADTAKLISPKLEWRHREIVFEKAFPQLQNLTMIVVDGATPELADEMARERLAAALQERPNLFHNVRRPDGGPFFERNGLLLLSTDDVELATELLMRVQPILSALANDPSLRRVEDAVLHPAGRPQRRGQAEGYRAPDDCACEHLREGRGRRARLPFLADAGRRHGARAARHTAHHPGSAGHELRRAAARAARERSHSRRGGIAGAGIRRTVSSFD